MFEFEKDEYGINRYIIHDNPQLSGRPIEGIAGGRVVAYWPSDLEIQCGLRSLCGGYIPAMIVSSWQQPGVVPTTAICNLQLFVDQANCHLEQAVQNLKEKGNTAISGSTRCSAAYSEVPAKGCWTWVPKA